VQELNISTGTTRLQGLRAGIFHDGAPYFRQQKRGTTPVWGDYESAQPLLAAKSTPGQKRALDMFALPCRVYSAEGTMPPPDPDTFLSEKRH
jgi:hypothetical protein